MSNDSLDNRELTFSVMQAFLDQECGDHLPLGFIQGHVLGWLAVNPAGEYDSWRDSLLYIFPQIKEPVTQSSFLPLFWQKTRSELAAEGYQLKLAIPSDDEPMAERLGHLAHWARGFIQPFGDLNVGERQWGEEAIELIESITALSEVDPNSIEGMHEDESENHFMEIVEFARLAPYLLVGQELSENHAQE